MKTTTKAKALDATLFPEPPGDLGDAPSKAPFPYRDYVAALQEIRTTLEEGTTYILLTGPSGAGKTSLQCALQGLLERPRFHIVYVSSSSASVRGIVNALARTLLVPTKRTALETGQAVAHALKATATLYVLWIDEADLVPHETLAEVRIVAEALGTPQLLSVVLSGLPELRATLDAPALFPLKRRIAVRCHLTGLSRDELDAFLVHRHGRADASRIPAALHDEIFERTEAIPALLDKVTRSVLRRTAGPVTQATLQEAFHAAGI